VDGRDQRVDVRALQGWDGGGQRASRPGATRCKAPRHRRHSWQPWHCGVCKLQILGGPVGFESHPLRQHTSSVTAPRAYLYKRPLQLKPYRPFVRCCAVVVPVLPQSGAGCRCCHAHPGPGPHRIAVRAKLRDPTGLGSPVNCGAQVKQRVVRQTNVVLNAAARVAHADGIERTEGWTPCTFVSPLQDGAGAALVRRPRRPRLTARASSSAAVAMRLTTARYAAPLVAMVSSAHFRHGDDGPTAVSAPRRRSACPCPNRDVSGW